MTFGLPGLASSDSWKVVEAVTDKDGRFTILGSFNPLINDPYITIYKHGYVAWNNILVFPGTKRRLGFEWKEGNVYEMEMFMESYSYNKHQSFISDAVQSYSNKKQKMKFISEYEKWERDKVIDEMNSLDQKRYGQ